MDQMATLWVSRMCWMCAVCAGRSGSGTASITTSTMPSMATRVAVLKTRNAPSSACQSTKAVSPCDSSLSAKSNILSAPPPSLLMSFFSFFLLSFFSPESLMLWLLLMTIEYPPPPPLSSLSLAETMPNSRRRHAESVRSNAPLNWRHARRMMDSRASAASDAIVVSAASSDLPSSVMSSVNSCMLVRASVRRLNTTIRAALRPVGMGKRPSAPSLSSPAFVHVSGTMRCGGATSPRTSLYVSRTSSSSKAAITASRPASEKPGITRRMRPRS
mmetsp:Transcript_13174/g.43443  ORF Transcript_13174/g.43443 Transcript_13174/m.43443 type:complete len:273 (-) Transcript_13174:723-1541(-)